MFNELFFVFLCVCAHDRVDSDKLLLKREFKADPQVVDISGYYICKGSEASGKNYTGIAVIVRRGDVYVVTWVINASAFTGIGVCHGDNFAVSWALQSDKGLIKGVNSYKIERGPYLSGVWSTFPGQGARNKEVLVFLKSMEAEKD